MPVSKTRKKSPPKRERSDTLPPANLTQATRAVAEAAVMLLQEAELVIRQAARDGDQEALDAAVEVHHYLRTGTLGIMIADSRLTGLPDPRESEVLK